MTAGPQIKLSSSLISSKESGCPVGSVCTFLDEMVAPGVTYCYWPENVDLYGAKARRGSATAILWPEAPFKSYLPVVVK